MEKNTVCQDSEGAQGCRDIKTVDENKNYKICKP